MAAQTKATPKFKLAAFREMALESKGMSTGVDIELDAGTYDVIGYDDDGAEVVLDTVEVEDGEVVHIPHPLMLADDRQHAFDKFQQGEDLDQIDYTDDETGEIRRKPRLPFVIDGNPAPPESYRMAAAIIGEGEVHRLLAGGGHCNDVGMAWQWLTTDSRLSAPKAPKRPR